MGFTQVFDFVDGKLEWITQGLPVDGVGPYYRVAGQVADREAVLVCRIGERLADVADQLNRVAHEYCVVLNDHDILLGRMRTKNLRGADRNLRVEQVMEPGPTTVRPTEPAAALVERMKAKKVPAVIVTTNRGHLIGAATQRALEDLLSTAR